MSSESIARLRSLFETELSLNPTLYHATDILRMRTEDWQIGRYLTEHESDETRAFAALLATLQWKASFGLHDRTDAYFPAEFWDIAHIEMVGRDRAGHRITWEATRDIRAFHELSLLVEQFTGHILERADRAAGQSGNVFVVDTAGTSLFNVDRNAQKFTVSILGHFPGAFKAFYLVDTPWVLNTLVKWVLGWMNPELRSLVNFVTAEEVKEFIDEKWIPVSMRGGVREPVRLTNLVPLEERAQDLGLSEAFVDTFYETMKIKRPSGREAKGERLSGRA